MELIINRKTWLRGEGNEASRLLRAIDGKMCCLGFYGLACGLQSEDIKGREAPDGASKEDCIADVREVAHPLVSKWQSKAPWLYSSSGFGLSHACLELMKINDDEGIDASERERDITAIFASAGIDVKFVDS